MSLRRGFKSRANQISVRLRRGQGLPPEAPIDLRVVAARMQIDVVALSSFHQQHPAAVTQLSQIDPGAFSAATLRGECGKRIIVHNDFHDPGRQQNSVAHELSHVLLGHPFTLPIDASGCRNLDRDIEDEASWLGAVILISDEAAIHIVREEFDSDTACSMYRVSLPLLRMRINASGARIRVQRSYH
jgi:IrrE N-terminal-like domain